MNHDYTYRAYGLTIKSEFPLPELAAGMGEPDVTIRYGRVPETIENARVQMVRFEASPGYFLLKVDGIARYYVREGKEIIVEPYTGSPDRDIRLFLLGSVFAALLHQREDLVLHGAAIAVNNHAVVFTGASGCGKSTLAAKFYQKGHPVLADDLCVILGSLQDTPRVAPSFPRLTLWADAVAKLGENITGLDRARANINKYVLPVQDAFCAKPLPLSRIYILMQGGADTSVTKVQGSQKIRYLIASTGHPKFLEGQAGKALNFKQCSNAATNVEMYLVTWLTGSFWVDQLTALIESEMMK